MIEQIVQGDCLEVLKTLQDCSVDMCVTSPPYYGLRDYGVAGQIGLEETPDEYVEKLVCVFHEVKRVLKDDGTLWLNIGDSYNGSGGNHKPEHKNDTGFSGNIGEKYGGRGNHLGTCKAKDLIGIPWLLAFALRDDGWYLRQDIIWAKPNPMPESVKDRCTKSHEYIFLLSKSPKYYFNYEAIQEESKWGMIDKRANQGRIAYEGKRTEGKDSHAQQGFVSFTHKKKPTFGGNKYGNNDDRHFQTCSGNEWNPQTNGEDIVVRNKRDVWTVTVQPTKEAHFATYPEKLIEPCILAGSKPGGWYLIHFSEAEQQEGWH